MYHSDAKIIRLFGFLGEFVNWSLVQYLVEDVYKDEKGGLRRGVFGLHGKSEGEEDKRSFYVSFITTFALLMHYLKHYGCMKGDKEIYVTIYVPTTLVTLEYKGAKREGVGGSQEEIGESEIRRILRDLDDKGRVGRNAKEIILGIASKFGRSIREKFEGVDSDYHGGCGYVKECQEIHDRIAKGIEVVANGIFKQCRGAFELKVELEGVCVGIEFLPIPIALTTVIDNTIVTFRCENAAEVLRAILLMDITKKLIDDFNKLRDNVYLLYAFDLTHGVNYSPSALAQVLTIMPIIVESLIEAYYLKDSGRNVKVVFRQYNSDPVRTVKGGTPLKPCSNEGYKIHLVSEVEIEGEDIFKRPRGRTQAYFKNLVDTFKGELDGILEKLCMCDSCKSHDCINLAKLAIASTALGLTIWTHHYMTLFKGRCGMKSISEVHERIFDFKLEFLRRKEGVVNVNYDISEELKKFHEGYAMAVIAFEILNKLVEKTREGIRDKLTMRPELVNEDQGHVYSRLILEFKVSDKESIDEIARVLSRCASIESQVLLKREIENLLRRRRREGKEEELDLRNLIAHAGFERSLMHDSERRIIVLKDSKRLRDTLINYIYEGYKGGKG